MILEKKQTLPKYKANISKANLILLKTNIDKSCLLSESDSENDTSESEKNIEQIKKPVKPVKPVKPTKKKQEKTLYL